VTACSLRLDGNGLTVDGRASDLATAIASCNAAGRAYLALADDAPSGACAELLSAFECSGIAIAGPRRNGRGRQRPRRQAAARYALEGGRTIVREGQPIVTLQRVDLGDGRHAISPHETDRLARQIVDLLNGKRRRQAKSATTHRIFVFRTSPTNGEVRTRWFAADPPTTWDDARRRIVAAGLLDERVTLPTEWKLVADPPSPIRVPSDRLQPLPGG